MREGFIGHSDSIPLSPLWRGETSALRMPLFQRNKSGQDQYMKIDFAKPGVAWVTGAGSGIGRALAARIAQRGWTVAVSARSTPDLESLSAEHPGRIVVVPFDVADLDATRAAAARVTAEAGAPDLVVLNAGVYKRLSAQGFSATDYRRMVDTNLIGTANCLEAVMPAMMARRGGQIAVVSSLTGYVGLPSAAAYGATKAALINMCEALAPELAAEGVGLSVINPGFVDTPATKGNDFEMPFLISVDTAVDSIVRGLEKGKFEIAFPWQMSVLIKLLSSLPHALKFAITRNMVRR
jgi:NAD(P)-dependent dehydrogenase (short-subunit alcohol dehydrogenase family)